MPESEVPADPAEKAPVELAGFPGAAIEPIRLCQICETASEIRMLRPKLASREGAREAKLAAAVVAEREEEAAELTGERYLGRFRVASFEVPERALAESAGGQRIPPAAVQLAEVAQLPATALTSSRPSPSASRATHLSRSSTSSVSIR